LKDGARRISESGEQGCEEAGEAVGRRGRWVGGFRVQKPLKDRDTAMNIRFEMEQMEVDARVPYCAIEATRTESESLPDILKEEISFNLSFQSNLFIRSVFKLLQLPTIKRRGKLTQHTGGNIDTGPDMPFVIEDLT
jgi:hypothetical protein